MQSGIKLVIRTPAPAPATTPVSPTTTAPKPAKRGIRTVRSVLKQIQEHTTLTDEDIDILASMTDNEGYLVLSLKRLYFLYDIIELTQRYGVANIEAYYKSTPAIEGSLWEHEVFRSEKIKEFLDADILVQRTRVKMTGIECERKSCRSTAVIGVAKQVRSADEPMTWFFTCTSCGYRWQEG